MSLGASEQGAPGGKRRAWDLRPVLPSHREAVLLFSSETWNLNPSALKRLEGFQTRCVWRMNRVNRPLMGPGGVWKYPPVGAALKEAGLKALSKRWRSTSNSDGIQSQCGSWTGHSTRPVERGSGDAGRAPSANGGGNSPWGLSLTRNSSPTRSPRTHS